MAVFAHTVVTSLVSDPEDVGTIPAGYLAATHTTHTAGISTPGTSNGHLVSTAHAAVAQAPSYPATYPARLRIPSLSINVAVQEVGVNMKGNIGTPSNFTDVGWYIFGGIPGDIGNAVIDGHVDNGLALAGVFKHLGDVHTGDDVYVDTYGHKTLHFVVTNMVSYPYDNVPAEVLSRQQDAARLVLITCGGTWVPDRKTYDQRLVVTAKLVR